MLEHGKDMLPMKFDITQAWKDETYRATLSNEQIQTLPVNPAGELSDADLETAFGGWDSGCNRFCSEKRYEHNESFALLCELNIFSVSAVSNIALLGSVAQTCING